jgi:tRNA pseudouridine55 synthase
MQGVLLIDKPKGWTSFDVVNYVRKTLAQAANLKPSSLKVGHTGTLDPLATGLLVLLVGKSYTRRATELSKVDKSYDVTMYLGQTSSTGDEEGQKQRVSDEKPDSTEIRNVLARFTGELQQVPPAFSAIKVHGQRAYDLARSGKSVMLEARPVTIHQNILEDYSYPLVRFTTRVSSGTYVRSLVEDMGLELKTGAYMSELSRTRVGDFSLENALPVHNLSAELIAERLRSLD